MHRRTYLGLLGTATTAGLAGCTVFGSEREVVEDEITIDLGDSDLSESEFGGVVDERRDSYGSRGVWGSRETEPDHDLAFQGAWTAALEHPTGVLSEHLLAAYRLPGGPGGLESAQLWLWSGADPGDSGRVRRVETGVSLPDDSRLGIYSPAQDYSADDVDSYDVESGRLDVATLGATVPLPDGAVGVGAEQTRIGESGAYAPYWEGESEATRSLAATTELRRTDLDDATVTWTVGVDATA